MTGSKTAAFFRGIENHFTILSFVKIFQSKFAK